MVSDKDVNQVKRVIEREYKLVNYTSGDRYSERDGDEGGTVFDDRSCRVDEGGMADSGIAVGSHRGCGMWLLEVEPEVFPTCMQ